MDWAAPEPAGSGGGKGLLPARGLSAAPPSDDCWLQQDNAFRVLGRLSAEHTRVRCEDYCLAQLPKACPSLKVTMWGASADAVEVVVEVEVEVEFVTSIERG